MPFIRVVLVKFASDWLVLKLNGLDEADEAFNQATDW